MLSKKIRHLKTIKNNIINLTKNEDKIDFLQEEIDHLKNNFKKRDILLASLTKEIEALKKENTSISNDILTLIHVFNSLFEIIQNNENFDFENFDKKIKYH